MKAKPQKVHRNFKISPALNSLLVRTAQKTRLTQTAIVELALEQWLAVKR